MPLGLLLTTFYKSQLLGSRVYGTTLKKEQVNRQMVSGTKGTAKKKKKNRQDIFPSLIPTPGA